MMRVERSKAVRHIGALMRSGMHMPPWASHKPWVEVMDAIARQHGMTLSEAFALIVSESEVDHAGEA